MKALAALITAAALCLGAVTPAHAATAMLVSCEAGTSVTGKFIYVGTYQYLGNHFTRAFASYCPFSVEVA